MNALRLGLLLLTSLLPATGLASATPGSAEAATQVTPKEFAEVIRQAKTVVIAFEEYRNKRESKDAVVEDRAWIEKLAALVEAGPLLPRPYCFCVSTLRMELYGDDGLILKLSLHHDLKLRSFGRIKGDYEIGQERSDAILALLVAEQPNARERVVPKLKWPEKKR
jgi:hypothetical protein